MARHLGLLGLAYAMGDLALKSISTGAVSRKPAAAEGERVNPEPQQLPSTRPF